MQKSKNLKFFTLCENSVVKAGVTGEWGYSVLIETGDKTILFDTGASGATLKNAIGMGLNLSKVDLIVLSHGHYDHTGGLMEVLGHIRKDIPIVAHPDVFASKYGYNKKDDTYHYNGIPFRREALESLGAQFELTTAPYWITKDIATSGEEPQTNDYETIAENLRVKTEKGYEQDPLKDDLSIFIRTDLGLVVVLGCAHRGMINILKHGMTVMETEDIYMVVGGTHLVTADKARLDKTIQTLREMNPRWIGTAHCTGFPAAATVFNAFPDRYFVNSTGSVVTFPYKG
ncbi:MAG: MBL fold metallo-hydrolase [Spirochaetales bacterium]|nr:MBL fold metallo-hydrolase [Spirochaetales bacterium]